MLSPGEAHLVSDLLPNMARQPFNVQMLISSEMPTTLASLPAEIHARIASMCALQDERFKH
jgi:hypothetical protein